LLSAQAFHWIKADYGLNKAIEALRENGTIALVWHIEKSQNTKFYKATSPVFEKYIANSSRPKIASSQQEYKSLMKSSKKLYDFKEYSFD